MMRGLCPDRCPDRQRLRKRLCNVPRRVIGNYRRAHERVRWRWRQQNDGMRSPR